ncbi:MAG TPA: diaminopimelate epimerase [Gemmatimonadaceae bacterium]|nr:diaminopimelate epimerase [Gemmatimonadaceae bacterium]
MIPSGREFFKMSGSGNDFVFVDARTQAPGPLDQVATIQAICARGTGVGADGIVFLEQSAVASVRMRYLNSDGSVAALCGNATLCTARLFVELGGARPGQPFTIESAAGVLQAVIGPQGPEVGMPAVAEMTPDAHPALAPGERRMGFAKVGIPHLVVLCDDLELVDVAGRGRGLRFDPGFAEGTNVDFVARGSDGSWHMRTYERGVEGETLACGTGAVASAAVLSRWGIGAARETIVTRSGKPLTIRLETDQDRVLPSLAGEARIVYRGQLGEV